VGGRQSRHGCRKGRRVGFPRFKQRGRRDACRFTTRAIQVLPDRKHIQLPRIGVIRTHESTRKLARHLERGTGRILAATITRVADRWYVAFTCELIRQLPTSNGHTSTVGVDVGVRQLAVLSTGERIANPRPLERRSANAAGCNASGTGRSVSASPPVTGTPAAVSSIPAGQSPSWRRGLPASGAMGSTS
jgi:transposase